MITKDFKTAQIGNQIWMGENLNIDCFQNGELIQEARNNGEWRKATSEEKPAWCYYNYNSDYAALFGRLYNGFALKNSKRLAPKGWHIPTLDEWWELINYLGGKKPYFGCSSTKLRIDIKECDEMGIPIEWAGTNDFGFSAVPGSFSCSNGLFFDHGRAFSEDWLNGMDTSFWSLDGRESVGGSNSSTPVVSIDICGGNISGKYSDGRYIRCIKD